MTGTILREAGELASPDDRTLRRRAVRGGAVLVGSRLAVQCFSWLVTILVARFLSPYDYGVLTSGALFLGLGEILADAGVGRALVQRRELGPDDLAEGFTLSLVLALILYAAFYGLAPAFASFLRCPDLVAYVRVAGVTLLLIPFGTVPLAVLQHQLQMGRQAMIFTGVAVFQSCLVLTLAALGYGFWSLVAGTITAKVMESAILSWQAGWSPRLGWPGRSVGNLVPFSLNMIGTGLLWYLYSNADFAILGRLAGPVVLGYYSFAFGLISIPVQRLTANCNAVAYPVFCRLQDDPTRIRSWYLRSAALLGLLGIPAMVGMALVAGDGITLILGMKWHAAVLPFRILSVAGVFMIFSHSLSPFFIALGRPDIMFRYMLVCIVLFPVGFFVMGSRYGAVGVALAWLVLYPLVVTGLITLTRPITGLGIREFLAAQRPVLIATSLMAAAVLSVQWALGEGSPARARLIVAIAVGIVTYGGAIGIIGRDTVLADLGTFWRELRGVRG